MHDSTVHSIESRENTEQKEISSVSVAASRHLVRRLHRSPLLSRARGPRAGGPAPARAAAGPGAGPGDARASGEPGPGTSLVGAQNPKTNVDLQYCTALYVTHGTRPTLSPDGEPVPVTRARARESSSSPNSPTPPIAPPSASPLSAIASLLLVFRPPPSARLRPRPPLAPRRAARPLLKRAAVHHGRGPRAPCVCT